MGSFIAEALKGLKAEIDAIEHLPDKIKQLCKVVRLLFLEIAGIFMLVPYACKTLLLYRSIPTFSSFKQQTGDIKHAAHNPHHKVYIERDVAYGPKERNKLDVYIPAQQQQQSPPNTHLTIHVIDSHSNSNSSSRSSSTNAPPSNTLTPINGAPVVFFIHGGVWASGEKWHYAPMAVRMAQEGAVVVVISYTLYPDAVAAEMVAEVSCALTWTLDNVARFGGDPDRVYVVGHSAGGHLGAMVLLDRALAAYQQQQQQQQQGQQQQQQHRAGEASAGLPRGEGQPLPSSALSMSTAVEAAAAAAAAAADTQDDAAPGSAVHSGSLIEVAGYLHGAGTSVKDAVHSAAALMTGDEPGKRPAIGTGHSGPLEAVYGSHRAAAAAQDARMPAAFIGMSGVYDIAKHYDFERIRGVHELSMMKRAMGGFSGFASQSPALILARAAAAAAAVSHLHGSNGQHPLPSKRHIPVQAAGMQASHAASSPSFFHKFELIGEAIPSMAGLSSVPHTRVAESPSLPVAAQTPLGFPLEVARQLPPCILMGSCADHVVPWYESADMVSSLQKCRVPTRQLIYMHATHADFVMSWKPRQRHASGSAPSNPAHSTTAGAASSSGSSLRHDLQDFAQDLVKIVLAEVDLFGHLQPQGLPLQQVGQHTWRGLVQLSRL